MNRIFRTLLLPLAAFIGNTRVHGGEFPPVDGVKFRWPDRIPSALPDETTVPVASLTAGQRNSLPQLFPAVRVPEALRIRSVDLNGDRINEWLVRRPDDDGASAPLLEIVQVNTDRLTSIGRIRGAIRLCVPAGASPWLQIEETGGDGNRREFRRLLRMRFTTYESEHFEDRNLPDQTAGVGFMAAAKRVANRVIAEDRWQQNYRLDLTLEALLELAAVSGEEKYADHVRAMLERRGVKPNTPMPWRSQPFGCLTHAMYQHSGDRSWLPVFLQQTSLARQEIRRSPEGAILHPRGAQRGGGDALLIDAMQEFAARMARAGAAGGDASFHAECVRQFAIHETLLRDPSTGLWSQGRGWIKDTPSRLSPGAWSRGHGWLLRGLTTSLEHIPPSNPGHTRLREQLGRLFRTLAPLQRPDGLWPTLMNRSAKDTPPDTSGSAMMATAFSKAWRAGWLVEPNAKQVAEQAFSALSKYVDEDGLVLSTSPGPGPLESETDYLVGTFPPGNDHGAFSLIFAAVEAERLRR